jgi:hypothetical protein
MTKQTQISYQDFNIVKNSSNSIVERIGSKYNFNESSIGFYFLILSKLFNLQEDEIIDSLTDTYFLSKIFDENCGPDRGVDALFINYEERNVHIFNFKYSNNNNIDKIKDKNIPSTEINNICTFIQDLFERNEENFSADLANVKLGEKVKEIWKMQEEGRVFKFNIHFVANFFQGLTEPEEKRLEKSLRKYKGDVKFDYILVEDIVDVLISRQEKVDALFKAQADHFFEKTEAGNRALVLELPALDLIRITCKNEKVRESFDADNKEILDSSIEELVFDDNVRVYLKQRTNINKNIKNTALNEDENSKIFFYNNGITVTCDQFHYQGKRSPTITIKNFQIVNGGQTVHALRSAFENNQDNFEEITLLCKIYETCDEDFKGKIAEYTNSQNPVRDRDIRSIDSVQIKLEKEFYELGYFYERKRNQHENQSKDRIVDSEKLGQVLLTYHLEMPAEAKNKKSIIFGEKYDEIFNDRISAENALKIFRLYQYIEGKKDELIKEKPFISHTTYYLLFFIKKIAAQDEKIEDIEMKDLEFFYREALKKIEYIIKKEQERLGDDYLDAVLFKSNRPKEYLFDLKL